MRNNTECTGLRAVMTATADTTKVAAKIQKKKSSPVIARSRPFRNLAEIGVQFDVARDFALPTVAVVQQPLLVVEKLLARLGRELEIRPFDDGVDRAGLLA